MNCRNGVPQSLMSKDLFCFKKDFIGEGGPLVKCFRTAPGLSRRGESAFNCVLWPLFLVFLSQALYHYTLLLFTRLCGPRRLHSTAESCGSEVTPSG